MTLILTMERRRFETHVTSTGKQRGLKGTITESVYIRIYTPLHSRLPSSLLVNRWSNSGGQDGV